MDITKETSNVAKFVCAVIVMLQHIFLALNRGTVYGHNITHIAMFTFLFLSGYGLVQSYYFNKMDRYWEKKFIKIYIPAVCVNLFAAIELLILGVIPFDRGFLFKDIFMLNDTIIVGKYLWYLKLLLVWYILFYGVYNFISNRNVRLIIWLLVTIVMWCIVPETYGLANTYSLSFSVGVFYSEVLKEKRYRIKQTSKLFLLTIISILIVGLWIVFFHSDEQLTILFEHRINYYVYTLFTNVVFGCGTLLLCYICTNICKINAMISHKATLL